MLFKLNKPDFTVKFYKLFISIGYLIFTDLILYCIINIDK